MSKDAMKLNEEALANVNGGMGQGQVVDKGSVRIENRYCPKCCKPGETTRFEINYEKGTITCLTCPADNPTVFLIQTEA